MRVTVRLFARLRDITGAAESEQGVTVSEPPTDPERPRDPLRDTIQAAATHAPRTPRRPPIAQREPESQERPLVQIGTVDVHVAAPLAPPAPPPPVPVATIPSGPLSRPAPVFGLAQG